MKFAGFTVVYEEVLDDAVEEKDISLPDLEEGMSASLLDVTGEQRFTQPPPRYTEASLVRALEEKGHWPPLHLRPDHLTIITRAMWRARTSASSPRNWARSSTT